LGIYKNDGAETKKDIDKKREETGTKYASPRDAGNFAAGAFAQSQGFLKKEAIQYG